MTGFPTALATSLIAVLMAALPSQGSRSCRQNYLSVRISESNAEYRKCVRKGHKQGCRQQPGHDAHGGTAPQRPPAPHRGPLLLRYVGIKSRFILLKRGRDAGPYPGNLCNVAS